MSESQDVAPSGGKRKKSIAAAVGGFCTVAATGVYQAFFSQVVAKPIVTQIMTNQYKKQLRELLLTQDLLPSAQAVNSAAQNLANANVPADNVSLQCKRSESEADCLTRNVGKLGWTWMQQRLQAFDAAYSACHDKTAQDPNIDLKVYEIQYENNVRCLLADGYGKELNALAKSDENLA